MDLSWLLGRRASHSRIDFTLTNTGRSKTGATVYRPLLIFRLINTENGNAQDFIGLVDTGSPDCLLPAWMGIAIGHDVEASSEKVPVNVATAPNSEGWLHRYSRIQIRYQDPVSAAPQYTPDADCPVIFCPKFNPLMAVDSGAQKLPPIPFALLGQQGFLDHFDLYFFQARRAFSLVQRPRSK